MRYAIVSDIHANLPALQAVLRGASRNQVDAVVCLGDLVGYHAEPNECVEVVRDQMLACVCGNHDLAAIDRLSTRDFGLAGRRSTEWTRQHLSLSARRYLESLPIDATVDGAFVIVHAALHPKPNAELHLSTPARVGRSIRELSRGRLGPRVCFFGHTHRAAVHVLNGTQVELLRTSAPLQVRPESTYLINPGSVGQPRDGDPRAAYAVFDTGQHCVEFHRAEYDRSRIVAQASLAGPLRSDARSDPIPAVTLLGRAGRKAWNRCRRRLCRPSVDG